MASEGLPVERLREFLRELKPEARAMLMAELERGVLRGDDMPAAELILRELGALDEPRPAMPRADDANAPERVDDPSRLFFAVLDPFVIDGRSGRRYRGCIMRGSLEPLWQWIARDLMPSEAEAYANETSRLLLAQEMRAVEATTRAFQDLTVERIEQAFDAVGRDEKALRRLAAQVGAKHGLDELNEFLGILKARDALAQLGSRLPSQIKNLADEQLDNIKSLLDSPLARDATVFHYGLLLVKSRLGVPSQLVRLAIRAAETDAASKIAETRYAAAVTIVLGDVERLVAQLRYELKRAEAPSIIAVLKEIHGAARTLRTEMDLSSDSSWARQLAAIRAEVSELLEAEIESTPGRVRRLLRLRTAKEIAPNSTLDLGDVAEAETAIELLGACRNFASELALSEATLRAHSELQAFLDTGTSALLESLRTAGDSDRKFRMSQVDAAVRFCAKVFGANYALLVAKAAEVARQGERKVAKA